VSLPQSLPDQLFLLACDPEHNRLRRRREVGCILRAAALVELQHSGNLVDEGGRPTVRDTTMPSDPVLYGLMREIMSGRRRRWRNWIRYHATRMVPTVRDRLEAGRHIDVERYRILGIFPAERVTILDPLLRQRIVTTVEMAMTGMQPVSDHDAALVALAAAAATQRVLPRAQRREYRRRIAELTARTGRIPKALRDLLRGMRTAAARAGL
jgi:hypothetical protein